MRRSRSEPGFAELVQLQALCDPLTHRLEGQRRDLVRALAVPMITSGGPAVPAQLLLLLLSTLMLLGS